MNRFYVVIISIFMLLVSWISGNIVGGISTDDGIDGLNAATNEVPKTEVLSQESPNPHSYDLCYSGSMNGWSDTPMTYDLDKDYFHAEISDVSNADEFKIKQSGTWDNNWGGIIPYNENKGMREGVRNGDNIPVPNVDTFMLYAKYFDDGNVWISVNTEPTSEDPHLCLAGSMTGWSDQELIYNSSEDYYYSHITNPDPSYSVEFKIKGKGSWDLSWGGVLEEVGPGWCCEGVPGGPNIEVDLYEFDLYVTYKQDQTMIYVNMKPEQPFTPGDPLEIIGDFNSWSETGAVSLNYNTETEIYSITLQNLDSFYSGKWRIKVPNQDWTYFDRGGESIYSDNTRQINSAKKGGDNYVFPETSTIDISLFSHVNSYDTVTVNTSANPKSIILHSEDSTNPFTYILDSGEAKETALFTQLLPIEDCKYVYVDKEYVIDDITTVALITKDAKENQTHTFLFKTFDGQTQHYLNPEKLYYSDDGNTADVAIYTGFFKGEPLEIVGEFNNWSIDGEPGVPLVYNDETETYSVTLSNSEGVYTGEWKIRSGNEFGWSYFDRGGYCLYDDGSRQIYHAYKGADNNIPFPPTDTIKIALSSHNSLYDTLAVNTSENPREIVLHSEDNASPFLWNIDNSSSWEQANLKSLFYPGEDCVSVDIDTEYVVEGVNTPALITKDADGSQKHIFLFKVYDGEATNYVTPERLSATSNNNTTDTTVWLTQDAPKNIDISTTSDEDFLYRSESTGQWIETSSYQFWAKNGAKYVTYTVDDTGLCISDNTNGFVYIKSLDGKAPITEDMVLYDSGNLKLFIDYSTPTVFNVNATKDKGCILPEEAVDVQSFADCSYSIQENKLILKLETFVYEYTATELDDNNFIAWVDKNGTVILPTEGTLGDIAVDNDATFTAVFDKEPIPPTPDPDPSSPSEIINAQTGDAVGLAIFGIVMVWLISSAVFMLKKKNISA